MGWSGDGPIPAPRHTNHKVVEMGEGSVGAGNGDISPRVKSLGEQ